MEGDSIFSNALEKFITNDGVKKKKRKKRTDVLKETIQYWTDNIVEKTVEIIELFY